MESLHSHTRRYQPTPRTPPSPSPRLTRSKSGTPADQNRQCLNYSLISSSQRFIDRSKSTTRTRNSRNEENIKPSSMPKKTQECSNNNKDGFVRFLQRGSPHNSDAAKKVKSATNSPSAWALSPGRSSPCLVAPESTPPVSRTRKSSGNSGVSGVLRYFRQKKVSPVKEEEYHSFRVAHNTLVQYRFANARAEAIMASQKKVAQDKIFCVWLRILQMRNFILEKKLEMQKLKHEIKLYQIMNPQILLLNEWAKLEGKNIEAVSRVTRKLSALSNKIPIEDAKVDVEAINEAMSTALAVVDGIEVTLTKFFPQVERILYMITELISTFEDEEEYVKELETIMALFPTLVEIEKYLRVHLIQIAEESEGEVRVN